MRGRERAARDALAQAIRQLAEALEATDHALRTVARLRGDVTRGDVHVLLRLDALLRATRARLNGQAVGHTPPDDDEREETP